MTMTAVTVELAGVENGVVADPSQRAVGLHPRHLRVDEDRSSL